MKEENCTLREKVVRNDTVLKGPKGVQKVKRFKYLGRRPTDQSRDSRIKLKKKQANRITRRKE